jgi:predicted ATPase/DNA-binding SARP family transcriptional activator/uncharacterized protein HemY
MRAGQDQLFIYLLGNFSVWLGAQQISEEAFERRKPRQLLKLLALQNEFRLHRDQVLEMLWPELPLESASSQLHKAVHQLRRALGAAQPTVSPEKLLEVKEGELRLWAPAGVMTDVRQFMTLSKQALQSQTLNDLERAAAEYRGDLLPSDLYEDWTIDTRDVLKERATTVFKHLADVYAKDGEFVKAQESYQLALSKDATQEDIHQALFALYAKEGNKAGLGQAFERYRRILRSELDEEPSPELTAFYQHLLGSVSEVPAVAAQLPSQLPPVTTPLIGREAELALIADNLAHPNCRLLSIVGTGGIGKTHLALEAAHRVSIRDGVLFAPLIAINLPNILITAMIDALGLSLTGRKPAKAQLLDYLRDRELLLVLDNFEHLLGHSDVLLELLQQAPRLKLLVTTRERLQVKEEWVVSLEGLAYPPSPEAKGLADFPAVQLFLNCAKRVAPALELRSQLEAVAHIAKLVDGLPLALELAAAWVKVLQCSDIAKELERNLDLLTTSLKNVPERHRSMQAVFEHSWSLMGEEDRRLYARLSVFGSSFTLEAAKEIAGATLPRLSELLNKSLLRFVEGRYTAHHLLRQYAAEKLSQDEEKATMRQKHALYYSQQLFEQTPFLKGGQQKMVLQQVALELDNIRLAWNWAFETGDAETINRSLEGVWLLVELRGWFQDGAEAFSRVLSFLALHPEDLPLLRAKAYARLGRCYFRLGQITEAQTALKQSLDILVLDVGERAFILNNLGLIAKARDDLGKAQKYFTESLELYRRAADAWGIANVLNNLGDIAFALNHFAEAQQFYQESLELHRQRQDLRGLGLSLGNLGAVYERQGDMREAKRLFGSSLETARELADPYVENRALTRLAQLAVTTKRFAEAKDYYQQSFDLARGMGNRADAAHAARQLGHIAKELRDWNDAETYLNHSLVLFRKLADRVQIARGLEELASLYTQMGHQERALELQSEATA